ncbi:MAG: amino acid adenylation domain-containing protein [Deltaproteobacteria bacterium]|nr:MAG: amino acid adenylation domain-containing protein [Deltaproteobacteria bacterium]
MQIFAALVTVYLQCLNGNQSYILGIPFHNRRSKAFKKTIGFFSEILPVRIAVDNYDTFLSLMRKVREEIFNAARHGQHSIANPHFRKVYEVVVNYHRSWFCDFAGKPAFPEWIHNGHGDDGLALQIHDFGASGNLVLDFDLHESIFNEPESEQAVRHFLRVLEAFAADPHQPLRGLTLLSPAEAQQIVVEWNRGVVESTDQRCVHEIFEEQVAIRPNDIAVVFGDKQLTYQELNRRANKLAHFLRARGVGPETLVGLYVERSLEMLVGLLGILKAGATYVPLDPKYPGGWLKSVLDDTRAPVLLTQQKLLASLPDGPEIICLDSAPEAYACESEENLKREVTGDHLAYVIYTSGSMGAPKGVEIPHKALMNFTSYAGRSFGLKPGDRVLQFASISFDAAVEEIFPCFIHGATLVLRTDSMLDSVPVFLKICQDWCITVLDLPTAYWHELTARLFSESLALPEQIRLIIIGGERAIPERLALWQACVAKRIRLLNTYGPTEATVAATMCDLTNIAEDRESQGEVPIGRPIANVKTYVLDQNLNPVPVGVPGELYIGGVGLARGYLNRSELTAEKFLPNPFSKKPHARLYKTGDLVRYRSDGNLEFLRRIDRQVKVRGFRVELEGIEAVLRKHPLVQEAVVVQDSLSTQKPLVAYLVPKDSAALNMDELRVYTTKRLPEYMVPAILVALDSLPLTPSGKVDHQALSPQVSAQAEPPKSYAPPRTLTEKQIAGIWSDVLQLKSVSRDDHFFELGGHSLLAIQVISRIRKEFEVDIALRAIFEAPTIADLAQRVEEAIGTGLKPSEIVPSAPPPGATQAPLSFSQTRIWFMDQLAPESAAYNIAATVRFT